MNDRLLNDPLPIEKLNPDVAPHWKIILHNLLQRDPRNRYKTADDLAFDFAESRSGQPVSNSTHPSARCSTQS